MGTHVKSTTEKSSRPKQQPNPLRLKKQNNFFSGNFFQASLEVGSPDDPYEQEADKVSQQVTQQYDMLSGIGPNMSADALQTMLIQPMLSTGRISRRMQRRLQRAPLFVQAKCAECEKEEEVAVQSSRVQRSGNGNIVSPDIESRVYESQGKGQQMDAGTQAMMETSFGADFSNVRIHTNSKSVQMSKDLGAHAFTVGNDIHFNEGKYQPGSKEGVGLLSHELTHVVQQGAAAQTKLISKQSEEEELPEGLSCPSMEEEETLSKCSSAKQNASLFRKEISKFTKAYTKADILAKQSILQKAGIGKINLKDNSKTLRRCSGCGGGGTPAPAVARKAVLKSGPTYTPNGTIAATNSGGRKSAFFKMATVFENDPTNGIHAACGEVRQYMKWSAGEIPNHAGYQPASSYADNTWYEDRNDANKRYGHRSGSYVGLGDTFTDAGGTEDRANGTHHNSSDSPDTTSARTGFWYFKLEAIDTCNGDRVLGTDLVTVSFA